MLDGGGVPVGFAVRIMLRVLSYTWSPMMRALAKWRPDCATRRFASLRCRLDGLREQATVGTVNERFLLGVALRLEWLSVWPRGIRGERAARMVGAEADYLHRCTGSEYGLELARRKFPKDGPQEWRTPTDSQGEFMGEEYRLDQLTRYYEQLKKNG